MFYLIHTQHLEDYEVRFKPKGGRNFVVSAPCYFTALAQVQKWLFTNQAFAVHAGYQPSVEFPLCDYEAHKVFDSESEALADIPDWERRSVERLTFTPRI